MTLQRISAKGMTFPSLEMTWKRNIIGKLNLEVFNENRNLRTHSSSKCDMMGERGHVRVFQAETRY